MTDTHAQQRTTAGDTGPASSAPHQNVRAVLELERSEMDRRSRIERLTDAVSAGVSSHGFVLLHVVWFAIWIAANRLSARPFDPYPFNLLTMIVSLEAIILTSFVLMAQDRMTRLADRRAHLDLQVNLIAEQELTAVLRVVCRLAERAGLDPKSCDRSVANWLTETDVTALADELDREAKGKTPTDT
jgi:uncharacterized membrane protein